MIFRDHCDCEGFSGLSLETDLVLAVAITSRRSSGHLEIVWIRFALSCDRSEGEEGQVVIPLKDGVIVRH